MKFENFSGVLITKLELVSREKIVICVQKKSTADSFNYGIPHFISNFPLLLF